MAWGLLSYGKGRGLTLMNAERSIQIAAPLKAANFSA